MDPDNRPALPLAISSIEVVGLHGKFDYAIDLYSPPVSEESRATKFVSVHKDRLTLLFGRNGSGKTSVLRTLFHAISSSPGRGHRTAIARTRFIRFAVELTDGSIVAYTRHGDQDVGACMASVERPGREACIWHMRPEKDGRVPRPEQLVMWDQGLEGESTPFGEYANFIQALTELNLSPVFLGDSRTITSDIIEPIDPPDIDRPGVARRKARDRTSSDVDEAVERVRRYLVQLAFSGTQAGTSRVESVYLNVVAAISDHAGDVSPQATLLTSLIERVKKIGNDADLLCKYGLLPAFASTKLAERLESASEDKAQLLQQVLEPYLKGLEERIEALKPGLTAVSTFIDALNSFLEGKVAQFHVGPEGIVISDSETKERLLPHELSSGEKQIVLLFSDIVALQKDTRLFIIDEPELSLNPEWQRQLMPRLLDVTEQSQMQLLAATHSIEIMAQFRERIHPLERN